MTKQNAKLTQSITYGQECIGINPTDQNPLPVDYIPTPTRQYRVYRDSKRAGVAAGETGAWPSNRISPPAVQGSRVLTWRDERATAELAIRRAYLAGTILSGPR